MTRDGFHRAFRSFCKRRPFKPFVVEFRLKAELRTEFQTGERLLVPHPESLLVDGNLIVFIGPGWHYRLFDEGSVNQLDVPSA